MINKSHAPNVELMAQGVGNIVAPFFGGFAATGAIARTATNVRCGGRSPVAAMTHALFVLGAMVLFAPWLGYLPMASLAALLLIVAKNMSEMKHFVFVLRVAPRSDVAVLLTCFGLTVIFDMTIAVSAGIVLAAILFMRRMAGAIRAYCNSRPRIPCPTTGVSRRGPSSNCASPPCRSTCCRCSWFPEAARVSSRS
jgi:SulP family sulfate permease